jgi:hypothetical protein
VNDSYPDGASRPTMPGHSEVNTSLRACTGPSEVRSRAATTRRR